MRGILTERVRRRLVRHVHAEAPGALLSLDTFYVGRLKGVGKVWQITACDAACSYGVGCVHAGEVKGAAVLAFLTDVVLPIYARAGWTLRRVLTDRGKEFKDAFDAGLARLGIRHTRTQPRHAWTNGFVERFQGTILHEHWRLVFRRTATFGVCGSCSARSMRFWRSTIAAVRIRVIDCVDARQRCCSGGRVVR